MIIVTSLSARTRKVIWKPSRKTKEFVDEKKICDQRYIQRQNDAGLEPMHFKLGRDRPTTIIHVITRHHRTTRDTLLLSPTQRSRQTQANERHAVARSPHNHDTYSRNSNIHNLLHAISHTPAPPLLDLHIARTESNNQLLQSKRTIS